MERQRRELEEAEVERLAWEKEKLEEEKMDGAAACSDVAGVGEGGRAVLAASLPEAGPSRAPPQKPERTVKGAHHGPGIVIPKKNCAQCGAWESLCL